MSNFSTTFLTFKVQKEVFAIDVKNVFEVKRKLEITPVPRSRDYIEGIINFRGEVLTVVDLQKKLKINTELTNKTFVIIVIELLHNEKKVNIGIKADSVLNVISIPNKDIRSIPEFGCYYNPEFLIGAVEYKDSFFVILNVEKIFSTEEMDFMLEINK